MWDNFTGPQAKAFHLLKGLDLGSNPDSKLRQAGQIIFQEFGGAPGNSYTWVELKDDLTVSLLQARLIALNLASRGCVRRPPISSMATAGAGGSSGLRTPTTSRTRWRRPKRRFLLSAKSRREPQIKPSSLLCPVIFRLRGATVRTGQRLSRAGKGRSRPREDRQRPFSTSGGAESQPAGFLWPSV